VAAGSAGAAIRGAKIWNCEIWPFLAESFQARERRDTIFGDFCDYNISACAVSTFVVLPVINTLTENEFSDIDFLYDVDISGD